VRDGRSVDGSDDDLPIAAVMGDATAVTFREVAAEYSKKHRGPGADNHEENASCNSPSEVREQEDNNSRVHQNRQHDPRDASCHVSTSQYRPGQYIFSAGTNSFASALVPSPGVDSFSASTRFGIAHPTLTRLDFATLFGVSRDAAMSCNLAEPKDVRLRLQQNSLCGHNSHR
jgi:hypothetical protein